MSKVHILHENPEWLPPLRTALENQGTPYSEWMLDEGFVPLHTPPPSGVFYNRMSASSYTRGHQYGPELTLAFLHWLERGTDNIVLNNSNALLLEINKIAQYRCMEQVGVKTPATVAAVGADKLVEAAERLGITPFVVKPNRGGKGDGVQLFNSVAELEQARKDGSFQADPLDGTLLVQQYIETEGYITRCEFVERKFIYAVRVDNSEGFELCPSDACSTDMVAPSKFAIDTEFNEPDLIKRYSQLMHDNQLDIAAFEFARDKDGTIYTYDLNTNTNYNERAERDANLPVTGMESIAQYLARQLALLTA